MAEALRTGPFDRALQLAIAASGLTLARVEYHLAQRGHHIGRSTLSYWQQGRRRPERPDSIESLRSLEEILGLPPNSLSSLLGPPRPRGRWIGYRPGGLEWSEMWTDVEAVQRVLAAGSRRENSKVEDVAVFETFKIGANRQKDWHHTRSLVRAREDGADRIVSLYRANPDVDVREVEVADLENCRVGRRRYLPEASLAAFELLLDRSLRSGETHLFGYRFVLPVTGVQAHPTTWTSDETTSGRVFRNPVHSYVLQAEFDPAMLPVRCYWVRFARLGGREQIVSELGMTAQNTAHFSLESALPAAQAIRWEWE
ncbi:MAG: helix-turn-helix domain-containing protein [Jatrophihabitans sp.]